MEENRRPKQGEIYRHFKDRLYQIIAVATHSETGELMVVYQALYGEFKVYVRPLEMFISEVDKQKYPQMKQKYRFELMITQSGESVNHEEKLSESQPTLVKISEYEKQNVIQVQDDKVDTQETVNEILMEFLDAASYSKKLDILASNRKHINDRLINDMAVSLDCAVDDGPLDERIKGLITCLQAMCRFEDRRLR